jgi:FG-GAP repeat
VRRNLLLVLISLVSLAAVPYPADSPVESADDLFPVEPGVNAERGFALALDGDLLAVGAPLDDENGLNAGAVYVFRWETSSWEQEAKLYGDLPDPAAEEPARFGFAVAVEEDVLTVAEIGRGAVYVFRDVDGEWIREAKLQGTPGQFGRAVALDGSRLAVGSVHPHGRAPGVVSIYSGPPWTLQAALSKRRPGERFAEAVATAEDLLVVGAPGHSRAAGAASGAAYVFELTGGAWKEKAKLLAADGGEGDQLAAAVATDGTTVALGAPDAGGGAVYVTACAPGPCAPLERIAADAGGEARLGFSVAVEGNLVTTGAPGSPRAGDPGRLRIFRRGDGSWAEEPVPLPDNAEELDLVGFAVALDGERAVATAVIGDQGGPAVGAAWSFIFEEEGWREEAEAVARDPLLRPEDLEATARFGVSVAATEQYLVVGALVEPEDPSPGAVYVYRRAGRGWRQEARLLSPLGKGALDNFGTAVAVHGESLLVGAPIGVENADVSPPVAIPPRAYLFSRRSGRWEFETWIQPVPPVPGEGFGSAVAIEDDVLAIGAPRPAFRGAVATLERVQGGWWTQTDALFGFQIPAGDRFGSALALRQGALVIGAPGEGAERGAAYVALRNERGKWPVSLRLVTPVLLPSDRLGASVALDAGVLAVGTPGRLDGLGAVLVYRKSGPSWSLEQEVVASTSAREFGASVALLDDRLAVGAPCFDEPGRVFLFERGGGWPPVIDQGALHPADGDGFGTAVALTDGFLSVTQPGSTAGQRVTVFTLRRDEATEEE